MAFRWLSCILNFFLGFLAIRPAHGYMRAMPQQSSTMLQDCNGTGCNAKQLSTTQHRRFPVLAQSNAMELDGDADVDAWLVMCHGQQQLEWNMYTPILETVRIGVESAGATTRIIGLAGIASMLEAIGAAVAAGRRPMVFAVAFWHPEPNDMHVLYSQLRSATDAGAYLVLYQSEPQGTKRDKDGHLYQIQRAMASVAATNAHEMWDYCRANIAHYPPRKKLIVRYVPPGYVPKLDVGVDMTSPLKQTEIVGYMGTTDKPMHEKYFTMLGGRLNSSYSIWSPSDLRTFMETFPLQLNQHKDQTCCPRESWEAEYQHVETFRMASLLANKACVISAPSATVDMQEWKGVVNFVEVEDTMLKARELSERLDDCRRTSYLTFKQNFAPERLLNNSGFFETWSPRIRT